MTFIIDGTNGETFPDSTTQSSAGLASGGTIASGTITNATLPTATITTLKAPSGVLATQNGMTGIAKAWVQFAGASGTIAGSFNVSSVTRSSTGQYVVNFSTSMPNTNYAVATTTNATGSGGVPYHGAGTYATGSVAMFTTNSGSYVDNGINSLVVFSS